MTNALPFVLLCIAAAAAAPRTYRLLRVYQPRAARHVYQPPRDYKETLETIEEDIHGRYRPEEEYPQEYHRYEDETPEHVDYGAHTGHGGAFGWYADFPV